VSRFEFRMWSDDPVDVVRRLEDMAVPEESKGSTELYILSGDDMSTNAKVRDGVLDIKRMVGSYRGLERWEPCFKCPLPLSADVLRDRVASILALPPEAVTRENYDLETLVREILEPAPALRPVTVHKRRRRFVWRETLGEHTYVSIGDWTSQTVAVESEKPGEVFDAVAELGMGGADNVNYQRAIRMAL